MQACKLGKCDGSGMVDVYFLRTVTRYPNGTCYVKKESITRDQSQKLSGEIDWKDQTIVEAAAPCGCRA